MEIWYGNEYEQNVDNDLKPLLSDQNWVPALVIFWQASKQQQITFTWSYFALLLILANPRGGNVFQPDWLKGSRSRIAPRIEQEDRSSKDESPPAAGAGLTRHPAPSKGERTLVWLSPCFTYTSDLADVCKQWSNLLSICYWDWNHLTL